jgi:RNA polymerase sigma factor (sigma-70 family)
MRKGDQSSLTHYLRRLLSSPQASKLSDAELLQRFVAERDEAAFEVLLWRHGPKVLGVCRRILHHEQDTEDAFQATFMALVRKANSIGKRQSLGSWLYRVAYHTALRARTGAAKRTLRETEIRDVPAPESVPDLVWRDLRPVLDEEVNRLPEKYRAAFVLCYLDGRTNEDAARELGCPKGTILSRLAWARDRLQKRLRRRGVALSAGMLGAAVASQASGAAVPVALVDSALKASLLIAAGGTAVGPAAALSTGVLQTMLWTKVKIITGCILTVSALGITGGIVTRPILCAKLVAGPQAEAAAIPAEKSQPKAADPTPKEATYAFEFRDKPWCGERGSVLEWFSNLAGLPVSITSAKPTGTMTFLNPHINGVPQRYTLGQILDTLNEELLKQKLLLIRRGRGFSIEPANEKIDPSILPRISPTDLDKYGNTELAVVDFPLTTLVAEDFAKEAKGLLGPFGSITTLSAANRLLVQDTVGNLKRIRNIIKESEASGIPSRARAGQGQRAEKTPARGSVEEKLDRVLNRLDAIERRLDNLERSAKGRTSRGREE